MRRREFCRRIALLGGAAAVTPLLQACLADQAIQPDTAQLAATQPAMTATPAPSATAISPTAAPVHTAVPISSPTAQPTAVPTLQAMTGKVALVRTADRGEGVHRVVDLFGANFVDGNDVLLKPNFNSADPAPGSTHPEVLAALIEKLQDMGAGQIVVADRSGMGDTRTVMEQLGVFAMAEKMGFTPLILDELSEGDWIVQRAEGDHWQQGFAVPQVLLDAHCIVQTCNLKTHRYGGHFTLSLKNSVGLAAKYAVGGGYNYMQELHGSRFQRHMIAEINRVYTPSLVVMDCVEAFADGGPDRGRVVRPEVMLAGTDRVALDAVGVAILRFFGTTPEVSRGRVFEQEQIARAVELGLGASGPDQIEILTEDAEGEAFATKIRELLV